MPYILPVQGLPRISEQEELAKATEIEADNESDNDVVIGCEIDCIK